MDGEVAESAIPDMSGFDPYEHLERRERGSARFMNALVAFDKTQTAREARSLVADLKLPEALERALATASAHASGQDTTLGNIRSRATAILGSATVVVALASSVGLLTLDPARPTTLLAPGAAAWILFGISLGLLVLAILIQWPLTWTFDAGTNFHRKVTSKLEDQARELIILEVGIARNACQLHRLLQALILMFVLLAAEAVVVLLVLAGRLG